MTHFTGDLHGSPERVLEYIKQKNLGRDDVIVLLGDVGANYFGDLRDDLMKKHLDNANVTLFCIHGNHEQRPEEIPTYTQERWNGGRVWREAKYPNILFAHDGDIYKINGIRYLVIGGAYSVDKQERLELGYHWWPTEQPSEETKRYVESKVRFHSFDVILSHTCPLKYEPTDMFLAGIDEDMVDKSTEIWLDKIEESVPYLAWYCGHWHTDRRNQRMHFLFTGFETDEEILLDMQGKGN